VGADIFQRNCNSQLPRHCAKGNYILTKYMKLCERACTRQALQQHLVLSQYDLLLNINVKQRRHSFETPSKS
jgi:hypothetical protein